MLLPMWEWTPFPAATLEASVPCPRNPSLACTALRVSPCSLGLMHTFLVALCTWLPDLMVQFFPQRHEPVACRRV